MLNGHANGYETPDPGSEGAVMFLYPVHVVLHVIRVVLCQFEMSGGSSEVTATAEIDCLWR